MAEHRLSLAVNGRERQLHNKLITFETPRTTSVTSNENGQHAASGSVAIVGLGYVGLPTAVELNGKSQRIIGIDINAQRLTDIAAGDADLTGPDQERQERLAAALADGTPGLTTEAAAAAVIICVPAPVVIGGATPACTSPAAEVIGRVTDSAAVRPDVPADGLAGGRPPMRPGPVRAAERRGRASLPSRARGCPESASTARSNGRCAGSGGEGMNGITDVAIVGAGPYGLSVAAHLRGSGVSVRQFGLPMHLWRSSMPSGMFLKSQGFASNLSDPEAALTLGAFCRATRRPYADYGLPVPLDTFIAYGEWFQVTAGLDVEEVLVTKVAPGDGCYQLTLADGEVLQARQVVLAVGVEHFAYLPGKLSGLPATACTHSSAHTDLSVFRGQRVLVVGAGQSALESAALLHESGAGVQVVMRESKVVWDGAPLPPERPLLQRLREPEAGLGSGWSTWFYSRRPGMFRHLPESTRVHRARTALGPAGASWLRGRVEDEFPILVGHALDGAESGPDGVRLGLIGRSGARTGLAADHVIAATGYRADIRRLTFLDEELRSRLRTVGGTPVVGRDYRSTAAGLYVVGPGVAPTFGPVMRFVYGADHAARTVARRLSATAGRRPDVAAGWWD